MAKNNLSALRIHHFLPSSRANGPGERAVIWVQGCSLGCPGCFNMPTHDRHAGTVVTVDDVFQQIVRLGDQIEGVTISGGEPLQQRPAVEALLGRIKQETRYSVLLFSGFTWQEIQRMPDIDRFLTRVDVLLAGRYDASRRVASGLLGSSNKTIHLLTERYQTADLDAIPEAEMVIAPDGEILFSGINPLIWDGFSREPDTK